MIVWVLVFTFLQALADLSLPKLMSNIVDIGIAKGDIGYITAVGGVMLACALVGGACTVAIGYFSAKSAAGFCRDLRRDVYEKVQSFSHAEYDKFGVSSLITRTTNDISQLNMVVVMGMRIILRAPIMCIGGIIMALSTNQSLSIILIISMPILIASVVLIAQKGMPLFKGIQKKIDKINRIIRENLTGIRVIRAFINNDHEKKRFAEANEDLTATTIKVQRIMAFMGPVLTFVLNATVIAVLWIGSGKVVEGTMLAGDIIAYIQYIMQIMMSLVMLSMVFVMLPRASVSADRINEILQTEPTVTSGNKNLEGAAERGTLEFKNVSFTYPGGEEPAVEGVSFTARAGETTAIIGGTGSGKSALIGLVPRFYDPTEGEILLDGVNIKELELDVLRGKIGYVPQKAVLFSGTIEENIKNGKPDATADEVMSAIRTAQAEKFVTEKPLGVNEHISQGATNVSGGQKQRLSIARAIVRKPEIYVFDDSFSALDFKTDAALRAELAKETKNATVIIVAQRISSIINADRIIVLDEGRVAGMGTHSQLMQTCSVYSEIALSQLSKEELAR